ncbi:hypothetical protein [Methanobrevibacter arboriphilus]|uniref:hypothetical protein n=1 Tax=Methanobrevibacter arboriphilus TaxID=39441 RepID=UPI0006CF9EDB|nr:hypothetical protein [Methanobrevibacter arboriphilus]
MNIKGIVLAKRDNQYDVRLENTTRNIITYVENTTGLELEIGDIVIVTYTDYNDPPIITNVYDKTISGDGEDGRSILSVDKVESDGLVDIYRITYSKEPVYSYFQVKNGEDGTDGDNGVSITSVSKISTVGLVDTYRISFSNSTHTDFTVTNGADGATETGSSILSKLSNVDGGRVWIRC